MVVLDPGLRRDDDSIRLNFMPFGSDSNGMKLSQKPTPFVIPAKAGIQRNGDIGGFWIPAFAGKTAVFGLSSCHSGLTRHPECHIDHWIPDQARNDE